VPALLRRNGRRRFVFSAILRIKAAVTSRGPAFTFTRTRNRASVASDFSVMVPAWPFSASPPIAPRNTRSPSTAISIWC
jgi:hypothetical protein